MSVSRSAIRTWKPDPPHVDANRYVVDKALQKRE
jgi:hypothetical protein